MRAVHRLALWLFAWTTIVAPGLHLVDHRDDHVHTPAGTVRLPTARERLSAMLGAAHAHGDGRVHVHAAHGAHAVPRDPGQPGTASVREAHSRAPASGHDASGAAEHFGLTLIDPPAFVLLQVPTDAGTLDVVALADRVVPAPTRAAKLPRGPPGAVLPSFARGL